MTSKRNFEVIIVGGSYAGLSAAMSLGRSLRQTLIIDSGLPCNRQTPHSHNFITQDGETPATIASKAKEQVLKYDTVEFYNGLVNGGKKTATGFEITTAAGERFTSKKLIFATGIKDLLPEIAGFSDCWGISIVHCPYCHGYEIRHKKTAIFADPERAFHLAGMVRNLTDKLTLILPGENQLTEEQQTKLEGHNISVIRKGIKTIVHENGQLKTVVFEDETSTGFEALYAGVPFEQHLKLPEELGCQLTDQGFIEVDMMQKTTVDGIYACGDNASPMRAVAHAVASGNMAGAAINAALVQETF